MQRDYGSYFEDRLAWWFTAGQFYYYTNSIHGLAETFAPCIYDMIDFLYNDSNDSLYDELSTNEQNVVIPGIPNTINDTSLNIMSKYRNGLLYYDWDAVLMYIIENKERYEKIMCMYTYYFIAFKSELIQKVRNINEKKVKEQIIDTNKVDSVLEKLKDYGITETHWISRVFKNHWKGSCYDILLSPLFTLVNIGQDISRNIKQISDILYSLDEMPNVSDRSILVVLKERVRTFDELGLGVLETIYQNIDSTDNIVYLINKYLMEIGIPPKHRYLLNDTLYWMCVKGCMKGTYKVYNETEHVVSLFQSWQPFGVKLLLDYPY